MQPFYSKGKWKPERAFIEYLEKPSNSVKWWFKNGERDAAFFAVPYDNGVKKPFYVDFIVMLNDGRIGLFDSKSGFTQKLAGPKIDGFFSYIQNENKKGKNLFGGIVVNTDQRNYRGRWVYFDKTEKELKDNDFNNWKSLDL
jgi:type III restriction enzyme